MLELIFLPKASYLSQCTRSHLRHGFKVGVGISFRFGSGLGLGLGLGSGLGLGLGSGLGLASCWDVSVWGWVKYYGCESPQR